MAMLLNSDFSARVNTLFGKGRDEVSYLARAVNDMAQGLEQYQDDVNLYNKELEKKVEIRTSELESQIQRFTDIVKENEQLYKQLSVKTATIMENIADAIIVIDSQGDVVMINRACKDLFNLTDFVIGKKAYSIAILSDFEAYNEALSFVFNSGRPIDFKITLKPPFSGLLKCSMTPIEDGRGGVVFFMRNMSPPWGHVYDSLTMQPVFQADVRLFNDKNNKILETVRTDETGRYVFYVQPGTYYIRVFRDGYHFPTEKKNGYRGEIIRVESKDDAIIKKDILIDSIVS
jgi:PAS domain-containing protein